MNKFKSALLVGAALCAAAGGAQAAAVTLTGWAYGSGNVVSLRSPSLTSDVWAGGFSGSLSGTAGFDTTSFVTYCIELEESFSFSSTAMTYNVIGGTRYFSEFRGDGRIADRLGRLMTYVADHGNLVSDAAGSTALQLAIWNTIYDTDASLAVTAGRFGDGSSFSTAASSLLQGAQAVTASRFDVYALQSRGSQDFLLVAPNRNAVPEPASLALAGLALGAAAMAGRRTTAKAKA